jgi:hypothetical protein
LPVHIRRQLAVVLELVQRELRHRRAVPRQQVQYLDWLGGCHCGWHWRAKARLAVNARRKWKGVQCSRAEAIKTGVMGAKY